MDVLLSTLGGLTEDLHSCAIPRSSVGSAGELSLRGDRRWVVQRPPDTEGFIFEPGDRKKPN